MPYSETGGQYWNDPVNPARIGSDLGLPPTIIAPETVLPLNTSFDLKRLVHLGTGPGGETCVAAILKGQTDGGYVVYHVQLLTWTASGGWVGHPVNQLDLERYVYDARRLESGGSIFLVCAGSDYYDQPEPAPFVQVYRLNPNPLELIAMTPPFYVIDNPAQFDSTYHVHLARGRAANEFIVLHDYHDYQYLYYRAYALDSNGAATPLCAWQGLPDPLGPTGPGVYPEFELLELDVVEGVYLLSADVASALRSEIWAVKFDAGYNVTLGAASVNIPGERRQILWAHRLTADRVAVGISDLQQIYVLSYTNAPSIALLGTYSDFEDSGTLCYAWGDSSGYEYANWGEAPAYVEARFDDEAPYRYVPMSFYTPPTFGSRVGLFRIDPGHTGDGIGQAYRSISTDNATSVNWAMVALAPNRVLLVLCTNPGGSPLEYIGVIYEWSAGGPGASGELVYRSLSLRHDLSGRFKDVDARAVLPFNTVLDPRKQYALRDMLGRQVLQAWPVNPKVRRNEAEYGFETILGRMSRVRPSRPLLREYEPAVPASVMLQDVLTHFQAEFPWLQWEPLPTFAWYITGGLIVPEIRAVQITIEKDPDDRRTLAQIIDELVGAYFPEYAFMVSASNRLMVVPATFLPGYTTPVLSLSAKDIQEGGVFEEPSYTPIYNYQKVVNEAYDFEDDQVVLQPAAFIIKPKHWQEHTTGLPWIPGVAPGGPTDPPWPPTSADVGSSHGLLGLETRALVQEGINLRYTSYVPGGTFSFAVPVQADTLIDSGTPLEVDIQVEQWLQWRDFLGISTDLDYDPEHTGTVQNLSVSVPGDGTQVQILDASGNWAGAAPANYQGFRVYAAFDAAQLRLNVSVEWTGMTYRFFDPIHGLAVADAAVLIRVDGRGRKWTKSSLEISGSFGTLPQDYTALPGLAESQAEFGLQAGPLLTIRYFRLTPRQCAQIAEAIVRRSYKSRPRYRYELGPYGDVTLQMLNRAVSTPQGSLMRVTDYEMSVEYLPGEVRSSLIIGAEEVAPALLFGALLLEDGGYLLFENPLFPVGGPPLLSDGRGALLLDEP